jgi:hypothetical protein
MMHFDYLPSKKLTPQIREIYVLPLCYYLGKKRSVLPRECNINLV